MEMSTQIAIIVAAVVAVVMTIALIFIVVRRIRAAKADGHQNPNAVAFTSMGGLHDVKTKLPVGGAELERAQKFRERAKQTSIGQPEFRVSKKYERRDMYKTLGNHPDVLDALAAASGKESKIEIRRVSDDRTSHCHSAADEETGLASESGLDTQPLTPVDTQLDGAYLTVQRSFSVESERRTRAMPIEAV